MINFFPLSFSSSLSGKKSMKNFSLNIFIFFRFLPSDSESYEKIYSIDILLCSRQHEIKSQTNVSILCRFEKGERFRRRRELLCIKCVNYGFGIFQAAKKKELLANLLERLSIIQRDFIPSLLLPPLYRAALYLSREEALVHEKLSEFFKELKCHSYCLNPYSVLVCHCWRVQLIMSSEHTFMWICVF